MNHQPPWNFRVISGDKETVQSSRNENSFDFPESRVTKPNSRLQTPGFLDTVTSVKDDFTEFYGDLMDVQPSAANTCIVSELETSCEHDMGQSSGTMKKSNEMDLQKCQSDIGTKISEEMEREPDNRPKRTRSVEVHNQSERRRRDRINKSLKTLQELVPNCNKSNRASVLDDAVNYVKALRFQVEIMSAQGGGIFSAPFVSPSGYQSTQVPRFAPYVPISPKFTMGIGSGSGRVSIRCSVGHPMISATSASLHPSLTAGVGLPLIPASRNLAVPQMQMPFTPSQQLRPSVDSTAMLSNFVPGYSPAYNFSNNTRHFH